VEKRNEHEKNKLPKKHDSDRDEKKEGNFTRRGAHVSLKDREKMRPQCKTGPQLLYWEREKRNQKQKGRLVGH